MSESNSVFNPTVGSLVQLRSGGPAMTVLGSTNDDGKVLCGWMTKDGKLSQWNAPVVALVIFDPARPSDW